MQLVVEIFYFLVVFVFTAASRGKRRLNTGSYFP